MKDKKKIIASLIAVIMALLGVLSQLGAPVDPMVIDAVGASARAAAEEAIIEEDYLNETDPPSGGLVLTAEGGSVKAKR